jgi:protein phosphatase 2C
VHGEPASTTIHAFAYVGVCNAVTLARKSAKNLIRKIMSDMLSPRSDSSDDDAPVDVREMAKKRPGGPPAPPQGKSAIKKQSSDDDDDDDGGGRKNNKRADDDDDDDDDDKPVDIRTLKDAAAPSGGARNRIGDDDDSSSSASASGEEAATKQDRARAEAKAAYEREEAEERAREASRKATRAKEAAKAVVEQAHVIADDSNDSDMVQPPAKGSCSGAAPAVKKGGKSASDLEATMKDKKFKEKVKASSARFNVGYADTQGKRATMEDKLVILGSYGDHAECDYFAVFDGHGSVDAAAYCNKHLHRLLLDALGGSGSAAIALDAAGVGAACRKAFATCQAEIANGAVEGGTTACVALVLARQLYIANLGDARAVLVDAKTRAGVRASYDHKPQDPIEEARIVSQVRCVCACACACRCVIVCTS